MNRFWSILFLSVPFLGIGSYFLAALGVGPFSVLWLPENLSLAGQTIDHLWYVIHLIGGVIFLVTGVTLGVAIARFGAPSRKQAWYFSHHTGLEVVWTLIPGGILVFIALYQMNSWESNKRNRPTIQVGSEVVATPPLVRVIARRFAWEFQHAGNDRKLDTLDDVIVENTLIVPANEDVVLELESRDVIHSFFVPNLRLKQDIVPGLKQLVWFKSERTAETTLICAELCGWGHYTMQGQVRLVPFSEYQDWLRSTQESQMAFERRGEVP